MLLLFYEKRNWEEIQIKWKIKTKAKIKLKSSKIGVVSRVGGVIGKKRKSQELVGNTSFKHK